jgi:hypothetical protein
MTSKRLGIFVAVVVAVWSLAGISWFTPVVGTFPNPVSSVGTAYATTGDPDMYDKPSSGTDSGTSGGTSSGTGGSGTQDQVEPPQTRDANRSTVTIIVQTISDLTLLLFWTVGGAK